MPEEKETEKEPQTNENVDENEDVGEDGEVHQAKQIIEDDEGEDQESPKQEQSSGKED